MKFLFFVFAVIISYATSMTYVDPKLPKGDKNVLATIVNPAGVHVFATGADKSLYHRWLLQGDNKWSDWTQRAIAPNTTLGWSGDPAVGMSNDGCLHVFIRSGYSMDTFAMFQTDKNNPNAWTTPLESGKLQKAKWVEQPIFPTSDVQILNNKGLIQLWYRGFDAALYMVEQNGPAAHFYNPPIRYDAVFV